MTVKGNSSDEGLPGSPIQRHITQMAEAEPDDYALFVGLVGYSLELANDGQFDQALWVADEMIALAAGRSALPGRRRGRSRGRLGARMTGIAKLAKEEVLRVRQDAGK